jgi:hypothetical protein
MPQPYLPEGEPRGGRLRRAVPPQRFVAVIAFLLMLVLGWLAADQYDMDHHLGAGSLVADAEITSVHEEHGKYAHNWVEVEFTTAAGDPVRTEVDRYGWSPRPSVGDSARLRYSPVDPAHYVRDDRLGPDRVTLTVQAGGALLCLIFGIAGLRGKIPGWLLRRR